MVTRASYQRGYRSRTIPRAGAYPTVPVRLLEGALHVFQANAGPLPSLPYPPELPPLKTDPCVPCRRYGYFTDREAYCERIGAFFEEYLQEISSGGA